MLRLRRLFPTVDALLGVKCLATVSMWVETLLFSIYKAEKEHAATRRSLNSQGAARNFTHVAVDRALAHSAQAHIEKGGFDPAHLPRASKILAPKSDKAPALSMPFTDAATHLLQIDCPAQPLPVADAIVGSSPPQQSTVQSAIVGSSSSTNQGQVAAKRHMPFGEFHNDRMASFKKSASGAMLTPKGTLTKDSMEMVEKSVREDWDSNATLRESSKGRAAASVARGSVPPEPAVPSMRSGAQEPRQNSHLGMGTLTHPIAPTLAARHVQDHCGGRLPYYDTAGGKEWFHVDVGLEPFHGDDLGKIALCAGRAKANTLGCSLLARNVCRNTHAMQIHTVDGMVKVLNALQRQVGIPELRANDIMLRADGKGPDGSPKVKHAIVSLPCGRPMCQTLTLCQDSPCVQDLASYPYRVRLKAERKTGIIPPNMADHLMESKTGCRQ